MHRSGHDEPAGSSLRDRVAVARLGIASVAGLVGATLAFSTAPSCTFDLVEPRLDAGAATASSSGTGGGGGGGGDDQVTCLFGAGDEAQQSVADLAASPTGEFALVGPFQGSIEVGDVTLVNPGDFGAAFIARFDAACGVLWAKSFSSSGNVEVPAVAVDGDRLIAGGFFAGMADLAGETLTAGGLDGFVVGFDPGGAVLRLVQLGGAGNESVRALAAAGTAGWVVVGRFGDELWWGPSSSDGGAPLLTAADGDFFVMRIEEDAAGFQRTWVRGYGDAALPSHPDFDVAVDDRGNIALAGTFEEPLDLGGACPPLESAGKWDMFVAKLDPQGDCLWAHAYGSTEDDFAKAVAFDSQGEVVFSGDFKLEVDFGQGPPLVAPEGSKAQHNAVLVKLDADGATVWSLGFGDTAEQHAEGVAIGADDSIYMAIDFESQADLDPMHAGGEVESVEQGKDVLVASFDRDGQFRWARRYGGGAAQHGERVAVDSTGLVTVAGKFSGALETSAGTITGDDLGDAFAMRFAP